MFPEIYNDNNILISVEDVENIINKYLENEVKVKKIKLYQMALTHKSYTKDAYIYDKKFIFDKKNSLTPKQKKFVVNIEVSKLKKPKNVLKLREFSYERLEFLGDSIIRFIISDYIFHRYDKQDEGFLTKLRIEIENGEQFAKFSKILGLEKYMLIAKQIELVKGRNILNILEDVFEAFVGAIHEEFGIEICKEFFINLFEQSVNLADLLSTDTNYKEQLNKHFHKMKWPLPKYVEILPDNKLENSSIKRKVTVRVVNKDGRVFGTGIGSNKKKAEKDAAFKTLVSLGVLKEEV